MYSKLATLVVGFIVTSINLSCQKKDDAASEQVRRPVLSQRRPASYELSDADCQSRRDKVSLDGASLWGWDQGSGLVAANTPLVGISSSHSLVSDTVKNTRYGRTFKRTCPKQVEDSPTGLCRAADGSSINYEIESEEHFLRVCERETDFPRDSFENVGLTSIHYLSIAGRAYEKATGRALPKIDLEVLPIFETTESEGVVVDGVPVDIKYFITDNLAYFPSRQIVAVFPQSMVYRIAQRHRYWESSFVLAHELGHHIEETLNGDSMRTSGLQWDVSTHGYRATGASGPSLGTAVAMTAVSEAFADLVGYYAGDEDPASLQNLDCIGPNRMITSAFFGDKKSKKVLDLKAAMDLIRGNSDKVMSNCNDVDLSDPHVTGAMIAHVAHVIFSEVVAEFPSSKPSIDKYRLALDWRERIGRQAHSSALDLFEKLGKTIEESVMKYYPNTTNRSRICALSREFIPVSKIAAFDGDCTDARSATR